MNILASRLPAVKFLMIAGGIQLGLTLFSNVQPHSHSGNRHAHAQRGLVHIVQRKSQLAFHHNRRPKTTVKNEVKTVQSRCPTASRKDSK